MRSRKLKKIIQVVSLVPLVAFLSSCGGQPYDQNLLNGLTQQLNNIQQQLNNNVATPGTPTGGNTTTDQSDSVANLIPSITRSFKLQDTATPDAVCASPTPSGVNVGSFGISGVRTDNLMKVTVKSGPPSNLPCTKGVVQYSCLQMDVTVGSHTETVTVSYGNPAVGLCAGMPNKQTVDFSDQTGSGPLTITVNNPQIDNCRGIGDGMYFGNASLLSSVPFNGASQIWVWAQGALKYAGCLMQPVYDNYIVSGSLSIYTNTP